MADSFTFTVNGKSQSVTSERDRSLLEILREDLQITGPKYGCGEGACGACSVLIEGKRTFSCSTPIAQVAGKSIVTIEGLSSGSELHPVQSAFIEAGAYQCGYCTPGMIIGAVALLDRKPHPTDAEIIEWMNGHLCRCCGYPKILEAVRLAAEAKKA